MKMENALQRKVRPFWTEFQPYGDQFQEATNNYMEFQSFSTANKTISGAKRQPEEREKNLCLLDFRNDWQRSAKIKPKTPEQLVSKQANEMNRQLSKEEARTANQCLQKVFNIPSVREMQTKTILRHLLICLTPGRTELPKDL